MSAALSMLIAFLSVLSAGTAGANKVQESSRCPIGAVIDRVEGERVVLVLGAGVRSIAANSIEPRRGATVREGMRVRRSRDGRCVADAVDSALSNSVRARLRALGVRR